MWKAINHDDLREVFIKFELQIEVVDGTHPINLQISNDLHKEGFVVFT